MPTEIHVRGNEMLLINLLRLHQMNLFCLLLLSIIQLSQEDSFFAVTFSKTALKLRKKSINNYRNIKRSNILHKFSKIVSDL